MAKHGGSSSSGKSGSRTGHRTSHTSQASRQTKPLGTMRPAKVPSSPKK